jgi:hypothetical protein
MVIEADMAGNYVGSSYGWATTRLVKIWIVVLAQRKLEWEQILEESWVKYVATATSEGLWGAVLVKRRW